MPFLVFASITQKIKLAISISERERERERISMCEKLQLLASTGEQGIKEKKELFLKEDTLGSEARMAVLHQ